MSTLEAAIGTETPERERARLFLALANATMAAIVGALTLGPAVAVIGALAMLLLPYLPLLWQKILELNGPNQLACAMAFAILLVALGVVIWGIKFAFDIALVLAPTMLVVVCLLARANSLQES